MDKFDYLLPLKVPFKIFSISFLMQRTNASKFYKIFGVFSHFFLVEMIMLGEIVYMFKAKDLVDFSDVTSITFTYVLLCVKSISFIKNIEAIFGLLEELKGLILICEEIGDKSMENMKSRMLQVRRFFRIFWGSCLSACFFGGIVPIATYIADPRPPFKIGFKVWTPFDHECNIIGFIVVTIYELIDPPICCGMVAATDTLPIFFFNAASGLIEELCETLKQIGSKSKDELDDEESLKQLEKCIDFHLKLKSFISKAESIFSPMILVQGAISLLILCTTAFTLSKVCQNRL